MHRRLGGGESRVAGEDTPHAPRAFAEPRALGQLWCAGSGTAKVASRARIRPNCSASVRRPPSLRSTPGQRSLGSTLVRRLGGGESRVAGEDTPQLLRERSPNLEPWVNAGAEVFGVNSGAPARGRRKSRRGRGYAPCSASVRRPPCLRVTPGQRSLGSTQLRRLGGGKSRVAGEDTPNCSASVRRPPSLRSTLGQRSLGSTQLHRDHQCESSSVEPSEHRSSDRRHRTGATGIWAEAVRIVGSDRDRRPSIAATSWRNSRSSTRPESTP